MKQSLATIGDFHEQDRSRDRRGGFLGQDGRTEGPNWLNGAGNHLSAVGGDPADVLGGLRAICMGFPEATERLSHGAPSWFVRDKSQFVTYWGDGHHGNRFPHLWCAAMPGVQQDLIETEPERFFRPPYVGPRGWIGVRLDVDLDWQEMARICEEAYRTVAPKGLVARLDAGPG